MLSSQSPSALKSTPTHPTCSLSIATKPPGAFQHNCSLYIRHPNSSEWCRGGGWGEVPLRHRSGGVGAPAQSPVSTVQMWNRTENQWCRLRSADTSNNPPSFDLQPNGPQCCCHSPAGSLSQSLDPSLIHGVTDLCESRNESLAHALALSFVHSLTYLDTYSMTHSRSNWLVTYSMTHYLTNLFTYSLAHSVTDSVSETYALSQSLSDLLIQSLTESLIHSYLFPHSLTHSLTQLLTWSLTECLVNALAGVFLFSKLSRYWRVSYYWCVSSMI